MREREINIDVMPIALAVFIGGLGALLAHDLLVAAWTRYETEQAVKKINAEFRQMQVPKVIPVPVPMAPEPSKAQLERERQQQLAEEARLNAIGKENTFQRRFKPSAKCQADPSTMECANEAVKARREFDANWGK